jgi:hypothetical protein
MASPAYNFSNLGFYVEGKVKLGFIPGILAPSFARESLLQEALALKSCWRQPLRAYVKFCAALKAVLCRIVLNSDD